MNTPSTSTPRTAVYVDGFNLFYGALKGTPYKWLDLAALCGMLLPADHVVAIHYYTARVSARPGNPMRQPISKCTCALFGRFHI